MGRLSRHVIAALFAASAMTCSAASAKPSPRELEPTSKWLMDYRDNSCRLSRQFGAGDEQILLMLSQYGPSDAFRVTVAGKPTKVLFSRSMKVQFGPNEEVQTVIAEEGTLGKYPALLFARAMTVAKSEPDAEYKFSDPSTWQRSAPPTSEQLAGVRNLTIGVGRSRPLVLKTGSLSKPFEALTTCVDNLVKSWGLDPAIVKTLTRGATPESDPGNWIRSSDYPQGMLMARQPAIVNFLLNVDANGAVTKCTIQETTYPKAFDDAVCNAVTKRGRFKPALDANGQAVASYWQRTVRFVL